MTRSNAPFTPTILQPLTFPTLLQHILRTQSSAAPTTLLVCSSREAFLQSSSENQSLQSLLTPTLHNLFTAQNIKIVFCASLQILLAYLSAYKGSGFESGRQEKLVLVNPLSLHGLTPAFSAQGLSRTFAAAVDTALRVGARLVVVECVGMRRGVPLDDEEVDAIMRDVEKGEDGGEMRHEVDGDPWEQEVPILNVSVRRFGSGNGERAWAGRAVKVKRIASRWFRFQKIDTND
ncbi:hypothetical protein K469DRAFT_724711 [Zopfia rhizophila CBS 207.26]|uniref:Uncharacterized protein n=1 Tax=Zopfia rhizophila CBS 207.26 TaxID=1314779 RepID=A0A6A6EAN5_9PEZI|nr:hypothetical protein K469DRAFT_724711 [Zopfia rhizophila CBS 207.26]